jgi:DMATS type aromatic prenyltransferase
VIVQVDPSTVLPSHCDWDDVDLIYPNVAKTVQSILGSSHELNLDPGFDSVDGPKDLLIYEVLSQILPFPSAQSKFYWNLFCRSFASMLETANYPHRAQTIHLTYLFARVIGMMGSDVKPTNLTMLTADGSTCEGSWVIPTDSSPKVGEVNRHVRLTIQPTDPRTGKFLRGSQVLDYLSSTVGSLGVVVVKDGYMDWRLEIEKFLFGSEDEDDSADECPPGTGFFLGLSLLPSGQIALKAYYQPCVAPKDTDTLPLTKSPVYITSKDFSPLSSVLHACHPTLVDQFSLMLEYIDTLEDRLKPQFHMFGFDIVAPLKNRIKIYFQTRTSSSWNDIVRNFTLGGRLNTPELHSTWRD